MNTNTRIFISWSGKWGRDIAEFLNEEMFAINGYEPWVSFRDIEKGSEWYSETMKILSESDIGIFCFTPGVSTSPWFNFEAGYIAGKGYIEDKGYVESHVSGKGYNGDRMKKQSHRLYVIQFGDEEIYKPIDRYQATRANQINDWIDLVSQITNDRNFSNKWVNDRYPKLEEMLKKSENPPIKYFNDLNKILVDMCKSIDFLNQKRHDTMMNVCFHKIVLQSYQDARDRTKRISNSYSIPSYYYAPSLLSLQEDINIKPIVKAIALVNMEEQFWSQRVGREILRTSSNQNIRIFVFNDPRDFNNFYETLTRHSEKYRVCAISSKNLVDLVGTDYATDFSIIQSSITQDRLLALYEDANNLIHKEICFTCDKIRTEEYENKFHDILNFKYLVDISNNSDEKTIEDLSQAIFESTTTYSKKPIEMSAYIDISDYDEHEEKHAYYQEMMQHMIDICSQHSDKLKNKSISILELGAGTGIFSLRLIDQIQSLVQLDIIEIDWHCFHLLKHKIRERFKANKIIHDTANKLEIDIEHRERKTRINVYHQDSRWYDPDGKFDYVFSSFADHHIHNSDKQRYFYNVKRNLNSNGLFVIGDEFLREYNRDENGNRELALRDYHNHIIEIANNQGHHILASLEQAALESGIKETGDFKISCEEYDKYLINAGFSIDYSKKIGPLEIDNIGGVYVYQCKLKNIK